MNEPLRMSAAARLSALLYHDPLTGGIKRRRAPRRCADERLGYAAERITTDFSFGGEHGESSYSEFVEPDPIPANDYFALTDAEKAEAERDYRGLPIGYWYWSLDDQGKYNQENPRQEQARPNGGEPFLGNGHAAPQFTAKPYVYRDPKTIPPRQRLYGQHYIRKFVSSTIAAPGIGKSSLDLVELIAMASGRPLLGVPVPKQLRVWYWNLEDPYDEIERRIAAILLHFKIDPAEIDGQLFVNSGRDDPLVIAEMIKGGVAVHTPLVDALAAEIIARGVDVLAVDPFVSCHMVPENDNGAIDAVTKAWAKVADAANCSIDLVHHVRKPANSQAEFDVNDARGASALIGTVRAARVLNSMTENDAQAARVPLKDKGYYFQVANGKANMSPPAGKADWYKFISVPLENDTDETKGDDVESSPNGTSPACSTTWTLATFSQFRKSSLPPNGGQTNARRNGQATPSPRCSNSTYQSPPTKNASRQCSRLGSKPAH